MMLPESFSFDGASVGVGRTIPSSVGKMDLASGEGFAGASRMVMFSVFSVVRQVGECNAQWRSGNDFVKGWMLRMS